jgi:hypothetical protein
MQGLVETPGIAHRGTAVGDKAARAQRPQQAAVNGPAHTLAPMNTPDFYAGTAEQDIRSAVTGARDFAETIQSAGVYALLAVAAAINRLANAVSPR